MLRGFWEEFLRRLCLPEARSWRNTGSVYLEPQKGCGNPIGSGARASSQGSDQRAPCSLCTVEFC